MATRITGNRRSGARSSSTTGRQQQPPATKTMATTAACLAPALLAGQATFSYAFPSGGTYPIQACHRGTGGNDGTQDSFSPVIAQSVNSATVNTATTASNASATRTTTSPSTMAR